uniref:Copine domain-containing protein n=1 Tax=Steinernema glaseri TaxID=37863 RepID=A0A1I7ZBU5_9BILA
MAACMDLGTDKLMTKRLLQNETAYRLTKVVVALDINSNTNDWYDFEPRDSTHTSINLYQLFVFKTHLIASLRCRG